MQIDELKKLNIDPMNKYLNYSFADRKTIERIVTVKEWNADCRPDEKINVNYGYVMPIFHGYDWRKTKQALINKYCFGPVRSL